ncbi:MAG TPA: VOC family protein [Acidimicrobiales bacterium]|nr:VOC family protein [Acidimicrobiales bacterium]
MPATFSHLGVCVRDLDVALGFYCDGLGFELVDAHTVGEEFAALMELRDVRLQSRFVRRDGVSIELLCFESPGHVGEPVRRPMNQLGLTHLSLRVDDLEAVARRIEEHGGVVVADSRTTFGTGPGALDFVYCTDPDGVRIELMQLPG